MSGRSEPSGTNGHGTATDEQEVRGLYQDLLGGWNHRSASRIAELFLDEGTLIGFEGSQIVGRAGIESEIGHIFDDHATASYVGLVRDVHFLTPEVAVLRAVAGLVPPARNDLIPGTPTVQTLIAVRYGGRWGIAVYQNTPAEFPGRPRLFEALTSELRHAITGG